MNSYTIEATEKTPYINMDPEKGSIEIRGRSLVEDSVEFYEEFFYWVIRYALSPAKNTKVVVALEYVNSSSIRVINSFFKRLKSIIQEGDSVVEIEWVYEEDDTDMMDFGKDFQSLLGSAISFTKVEKIQI